MPYQYSMNMLPMGRSLSFATEGETVDVQTRGFVTSEDGAEFTRFADGFSSECPMLAGRGGQIRESQIDHLLTIIRPDKTVLAYCNELRIFSQMRPKKGVKKGQEIYKSDIADIASLELETESGEKVAFPDDCGIAFLFSVGWKKGVFFDYEPICPQGSKRQGSLSETLGQLYGRLLFSEYRLLDEADWDQLFDWGLFPFTSLDPKRQETLFVCAKRKQLPPSVARSICDDVAVLIAERADVWAQSQLFAPHIDFIRIASSNYLRGDYVSAIQVLYPRIEGVLRECLNIVAPRLAANQTNLARHATVNTHDDSLLLPLRFERFLLRFYFRNFDVRSGDTPLSRHSIAHGVAKVGDFEAIKAAIGFLIVDQVYFYGAGCSSKTIAQPACT